MIFSLFLDDILTVNITSVCPVGITIIKDLEECSPVYKAASLS